MRIDDKGSRQQYADVVVEGVPATGVVDSGAEITIMNVKLFARIAAVARLKKSQLKPPNRVPRTYDRRVFTLDGRVDLDVSFDSVTMRTPIYIKVISCCWERVCVVNSKSLHTTRQYLAGRTREGTLGQGCSDPLRQR